VVELPHIALCPLAMEVLFSFIPDLRLSDKLMMPVLLYSVMVMICHHSSSLLCPGRYVLFLERGEHSIHCVHLMRLCVDAFPTDVVFILVHGTVS